MSAPNSEFDYLNAIAAQRAAITKQISSGRPPFDRMTLARGCSAQQLELLATTVFNRDTTRPTEQEVNTQVGAEIKDDRFREFSSTASIAQGFGKNGVVVVASIDKQYLTETRSLEDSWVCRYDAPMEIVDIHLGLGLHPGGAATGPRATFTAEQLTELKEQINGHFWEAMGMPPPGARARHIANRVQGVSEDEKLGNALRSRQTKSRGPSQLTRQSDRGGHAAPGPHSPRPPHM